MWHLEQTSFNNPSGFDNWKYVIISYLPQAGILNPLVKNNKTTTNEINQIVIKKIDLINFVDCDFLTKISVMPVTMNEGMIADKNNNPRSYDVILLYKLHIDYI